MSKKYLVEEDLLKILFYDSVKLNALEIGKVEEWSNYQKSIDNYLKKCNCESLEQIVNLIYDNFYVQEVYNE